MFKLALRRHETSTAVPRCSFACSDTCCYRQSINENFGFVAPDCLDFKFSKACYFCRGELCPLCNDNRGYTLSSSPLDMFSRASRKWTGVNSLLKHQLHFFFLKYGCGFVRFLFSLHRQVVTSQCTGHDKLKIHIAINLSPLITIKQRFNCWIRSNSSRSYQQTLWYCFRGVLAYISHLGICHPKG